MSILRFGSEIEYDEHRRRLEEKIRRAKEARLFPPVIECPLTEARQAPPDIGQPPAVAKYRNKKVDGYDSTKEAKRAAELRLLEKSGTISNLREQVSFELIPAQYIDQKLAERHCDYIADFTYIEDGRLIVEDCKSEITRKLPAYVIKRKLMLYIHGLAIRET